MSDASSVLSAIVAALWATPTEVSSGDTVRPLIPVSDSAGVYASGEVLVGYGSPASRDGVVQALELLGGALIGEVPNLNLLKIQVPDGADEATAAASYSTIPEVRYAELNFIGSGGGNVCPDDTYFPEQYHLHNNGLYGGTPGADLNMLAAWELQAGDPAVTLAILDSGIDFGHPEFLGRTLSGFDFVNEDADPTADDDHGVYVAGLAAATQNNQFQVAGVDGRCTVQPVKVLDQNNQGTVFDLVQGLSYCAGSGTDVVNLSLVDFAASAALDDALQQADAAGCILVACSGNNGPGDADVSYPGAHPLTISVGATCPSDDRADFSGSGSQLDFVAPGVDCVSVSVTHSDARFAFTGCSAATALASGVISLLRAQCPSLTPDETYERLRIGADDEVGKQNEDVLGWDEFHGHGRINAGGSLEAMSPLLTVEPTTVGAGELLVFSLSGGPAQSTCLLYTAAVNGTAFFMLVTRGVHDADGLFQFTTEVGSGLAGLVVDFTGFGESICGGLVMFNTVAVTFQ